PWRGWSVSSNIWTRCAGSSEIRPLAAEPWRVVEAQHQISTRKLVDTDEEQAILEDVLERHKPPAPEAGRLHYLLFTSFRYPPLRATRRGASTSECLRRSRSPRASRAAYTRGARSPAATGWSSPGATTSRRKGIALRASSFWCEGCYRGRRPADRLRQRQLART